MVEQGFLCVWCLSPLNGGGNAACLPANITSAAAITVPEVALLNYINLVSVTTGNPAAYCLASGESGNCDSCLAANNVRKNLMSVGYHCIPMCHILCNT